MAPSTIRKAIGTVKDQTSIALARMSNNLAPELEIAIVKATSHDEEPPDDKHIREILNLISYSLGYVNASINAVSRRLGKTRDWIVALKSLMLVHRLLADGDPSFQHELLHATCNGTRVLSMSNFRDEAHSNSLDHSAFVRKYAFYLGQGLESVIEDHEQHTRMKPEKVLERMHKLQQLLDRFLACRPTGLAKNSRMVLLALYPILRESFQLYADICEILALLLDSFFDMDYAECVKSYEAYASVSQQIDELVAFYSWCKDAGVAKSKEYPEVQRISVKLLEILEEFTRDRGRQHECSPGRRKEPALPTLPAPSGFREEEEEEEEEHMPKPTPKKPPQANLVDLRDDAVTADSPGKNLALALFSTGGVGEANWTWETFPSADYGKGEVSLSTWQTAAAGAVKADWEVVLMETASDLAKQKAGFGEGFDNLLEGTVQVIRQDPFAASFNIPPASYVQMADIDRKHQLLLQEQQMWKQYGRYGMQGQASITMLNNAYFYANSAMPNGMQTTSFR